jgi:hypothetical protein
LNLADSVEKTCDFGDGVNDTIISDIAEDNTVSDNEKSSNNTSSSSNDIDSNNGDGNRDHILQLYDFVGINNGSNNNNNDGSNSNNKKISQLQYKYVEQTFESIYNVAQHLVCRDMCLFNKNNNNDKSAAITSQKSPPPLSTKQQQQQCHNDGGVDDDDGTDSMSWPLEDCEVIFNPQDYSLVGMRIYQNAVTPDNHLYGNYVPTDNDILSSNVIHRQNLGIDDRNYNNNNNNLLDTEYWRRWCAQHYNKILLGEFDHLLPKSRHAFLSRFATDISLCECELTQEEQEREEQILDITMHTPNMNLYRVIYMHTKSLMCIRWQEDADTFQSIAERFQKSNLRAMNNPPSPKTPPEKINIKRKIIPQHNVSAVIGDSVEGHNPDNDHIEKKRRARKKRRINFL